MLHADSDTMQIVNFKFEHLGNTSLTQIHFLKANSLKCNGCTSCQTGGTHKFIVTWILTASLVCVTSLCGKLSIGFTLLVNITVLIYATTTVEAHLPHHKKFWIRRNFRKTKLLWAKTVRFYLVVLPQVIISLLEADRATVVVCFCEGMTVRNLVRAADRINVTSRILFIGRSAILTNISIG